MEEEDKEDYESIAVIGNNAGKPAISTKKIDVRKSLDEIFLATGINEIEYELIKSGSRKRNLAGYKKRYAKEAMELNYTLKQIGTNIKLSGNAIHKLLQ